MGFVCGGGGWGGGGGGGQIHNTRRDAWATLFVGWCVWGVLLVRGGGGCRPDSNDVRVRLRTRPRTTMHWRVFRVGGGGGEFHFADPRGDRFDGHIVPRPSPTCRFEWWLGGERGWGGVGGGGAVATRRLGSGSRDGW